MNSKDCINNRCYKKKKIKKEFPKLNITHRTRNMKNYNNKPLHSNNKCLLYKDSHLKDINMIIDNPQKKCELNFSSENNQLELFKASLYQVLFFQTEFQDYQEYINKAYTYISNRLFYI